MITTAGRTADDFLTGGGEMARLIRAHDWAATPLGPMDRWPQSLKTSLGIMLNSRHPMFVFWGPALVKIYNDAYRPITGEKHPWALGRPASEVWPEIWSDIKPLVDRALAGDATWSDDLLLFMHRSGFPEEVFFTFSYSPIPDESGGVGGMFCACTETTGKVLGERRLRALRDLAARPAEARTVAGACVLSADALTRHAADVPFALIYLLEAEGTVAHLMAAAGVSPGEPACPAVVTPDDAAAGWPLFRVADSRRPEEVRDQHARFAALPAGPWPEPPSVAMVLPLIDRGLDQTVGLVVLGISARRVLDDEYRGWCQLVASQIGASIANAHASEEERKRAEALAELDRAKTAFFTNVSHEFRTPLTLMLGPLEEILGRPGPVLAESRELLTVVHRNGLRLLKLVNTLLDFSRIETGRSQAVYEPTDLAALTADLASTFRSACERAGLGLRVECSSLPAPVHVDRDMWEKIVLNLLSNALKFTFDGEIAVTLRAVGDHVELAVRDTGIGIAAEELPHLFDRFYRVKGVRARTHEGTGIGLSLVQELVRLHGGAVRVESRPGQGSTFAVTVPTGTAHLPAERIGAPRGVTATWLGAAPFLEEALRWLPDAAPAERLSPVAEARGGAPVAPPGRRPRILWADDNADMRDYVSRLLGEHGTVEAVADGRAALAAARARVPDLVLADVMMPGLDGFELVRALRGDPGTATVPVILLSARAGGEAHVEGLQAGADDYIVKPFTARELIARIRTHLTLTRLRQEATREAQEARAEAPILGDPDRLQQVVWNLLSNAVKFTPDGGRVTVRMHRTASRVVLGVTDSGRGIRPEFLPRIFDRFSQAGDGPVPAGRGLGLGLAIVRHLVELHGGSVSVESPGEGRGATFTVSLPATSG